MNTIFAMICTALAGTFGGGAAAAITGNNAIGMLVGSCIANALLALLYGMHSVTREGR